MTPCWRIARVSLLLLGALLGLARTDLRADGPEATLLRVASQQPAPTAWPAAAPAPSTVRVLTYNLHAGKGPEPWDLEDACGAMGPDGDRWLARVADLIERERIDIVFLQEVLKSTRCLAVPEVDYLKRRLGYHGVSALAVVSQSNAVLSRWPIDDVRRVELDVPGAAQRRCAVIARVRIPGQPHGIWAVSTHLDQKRDETARLAQVAALALHLAALDAPVILAGDMNAEPGSGTLAALLACSAGGRRFSNTWSAGSGHGETTGSGDRKIDHILVTAPLEPIGSRVLPDRLSDHRALRATLSLPGPAGD